MTKLTDKIALLKAQRDIELSKIHCLTEELHRSRHALEGLRDQLYRLDILLSAKETNHD